MTHAVYVDSLSAELIEMSDEEVLDGQGPDLVRAHGLRILRSAKRAVLIRRIVARLDAEGYRGFEWRYHEGRVQAGRAIANECFCRYRFSRPFTVWADAPSLARVLAAKRADEYSLADDEVPF